MEPSPQPRSLTTREPPWLRPSLSHYMGTPWTCSHLFTWRHPLPRPIDQRAVGYRLKGLLVNVKTKQNCRERSRNNAQILLRLCSAISLLLNQHSHFQLWFLSVFRLSRQFILKYLQFVNPLNVPSHNITLNFFSNIWGKILVIKTYVQFMWKMTQEI